MQRVIGEASSTPDSASEHTIHEILPCPARLTFALLNLGGARNRRGKKCANDGVFQGKAEISVCRAMLVTEGVHRAPSL